MDIPTILTEIGLPEREVKVYLALLELGDSTVLPIAKKSGLKRTYCYDILSSLSEKGLVSYFEKNNRRRYVAEDPTAIEKILQKRLATFTDILPELRSFYNGAANKPKVRFYEGKEGLLSIYDQMTEAKAFDTITSPSLLNEALGEYLLKMAKKIIRKKARVRELFTAESLGKYVAKGYNSPLQEVRYLPKDIKLDTDLLLFEDKLVLISYSPDIHAIIIEGSSIVTTHKTLFELLWSNASSTVAQ